jgi:Protein of unknown function (DUF3134)
MFKNPALREEPRQDPAEVIPFREESSILDWLERTGRLIARDVVEEPLLEADEEISELMGVDDPYDVDDDDLLDDTIIDLED